MLGIPLFAAILATAPAAEAPAEPPVEDIDAYQDKVRAALAPVPGGLTSDEVATEAVATSPSVESRRADLMATAASVDSTIAQFAPDITGTATYSRISPADIDFGSGGASVGALNEGPLGVAPCPGAPAQNCVVDSMGVPVAAAAFGPIEIPLNNYSLTASLSVPFSDYALRLMPAVKGARAETEAAKLQRDAEKQSVELQARLAYYDWIRTVAQVAVAQETVVSTNARLEDVRAHEKAGIATTVDVLRLDAVAANAEVGLTASTSAEALAAQNLAILMGKEKADFEVGEDIFATPAHLEGADDLRGLVDEAMEHRLEIQAIQENVDALDYAKRATAANYFPRLDGFADATYANPNQRFFPLTSEWRGSWTVGASLTWRLSTFLQSRSQSKQLRANQRIATANEAAMRRAIEMEVTAAWQERERAIIALKLTERSFESTTAAYEQQVALFQAGEATTTDIIDSEIARLNATLNGVNARIDVLVANSKLMRATGRMKPIEVPGDADDAKYEKVGPGKGGRR
jgi:outer membrane protein TolC